MFIYYKEWCPNQFSAVSYCILFFLLSDLILCRLLIVINSFVLYLDVSRFLCDSGSCRPCDNFNCKLSLQLILCISTEEDGIGLVLTIHVSYLIVLYHYFALALMHSLVLSSEFCTVYFPDFMPWTLQLISRFLLQARFQNVSQKLRVQSQYLHS